MPRVLPEQQSELKKEIETTTGDTWKDCSYKNSFEDEFSDSLFVTVIS
jgi:hypothetical protein